MILSGVLVQLRQTNTTVNNILILKMCHNSETGKSAENADRAAAWLAKI
jgi:hypothetical protein